MKHLIPLAASVLLACFAGSATARADANDPNTAMTDADFVMAAGGTDEFERQSGQLAIQRAQLPKVRELAQRVIADHTQTTNDLAAAAAKAGVPGPVPKLHPGQLRALQHLQDALPEDFDKLYLQQQAETHQDAIGLVKTYAAVGQAAPLRDVAVKARPIVQRHLDMIFALQRAIH
jgi:putative membrane protein